MHRTLAIAVLIAMFVSVARIDVTAQEAEQEGFPPRKAPAVILAMQEAVKLPATPTLANGEAILLRLTGDVKVKEVKAGDVVPFVLAKDLSYRDVLLAPKGTPVEVVVQTAEKAKWLSRGSKLGFDIQGLRLLNGTTLPLRGDPSYKGGINPVASGAFRSGGGGGGGMNPAPLVSGTVGVFALLGPGKTLNAKENSSASAWVDENFALDLESFRSFQPELDPAVTTGRVQVARGIMDRLKSVDLYCNGVPIAHLDTKRKYVADLKPGWYRFAIHPKRPPLQIYVMPGKVYSMIPEVHFSFGLVLTGKLELVDEGFSDTATMKLKFGPGPVPRSIQKMMDDAKPVEKVDLYGDVSQCAPLPEEFALGAAPQSSPANATGAPVPKHRD